MDDTTDMGLAAENIAHFFADESCGQCTPCREGCHWMEKIFRKINQGRGEMADLTLLEGLFPNIEGRTICALADAAVWPLRSIVRKFRGELEARIRAGGVVAVPAAAVAGGAH
jgi:NADH-quinone oxidoreductase subunit F